MPLPAAAFGSILGGLEHHPGAQWISNDDLAGGQLDANLNAATFRKLGRVTGFELRFEKDLANPPSGRLVSALTQADLFRSEAGASRYVALQASTFRRLEGQRLEWHGTIVDRVSHFDVGTRGATGFRARVTSGTESSWMTIAQIRVGVIAAVVGLFRTDARDATPDARRLARALDRRIRGVLAGRIR